jgi:hypothetical protein
VEDIPSESRQRHGVDPPIRGSDNLYGLLLLHHDRRQILWLGVTAHPTAEWISQQLTEGLWLERNAARHLF